LTVLENTGILVICEISNGKLSSISIEGLGIGRKLADQKNEKLGAVILENNTDIANQAIQQGSDIVYTVDDPILANQDSEAITHALQIVIKKAEPELVILGQTNIGRDQAPRLAFRLNTCATLDCTDIIYDSGQFKVKKPVYGGNAIGVYSSRTTPYIVTIRSKAFAGSLNDTLRQGVIIDVPVDFSTVTMRSKKRESIIEESAGIKLEEAQVIVAGGRGIGSKAGFEQLEELSRILKGAVGASRPPCDNGWVPDVCQIGLTGKIVAPELYIAVAISGSSQHMSGCSGAKSIVAINKDKEANIFKYARIGAVEDWKKILPSFTARVKELIQ